jgi:predicted AlkP superfamily phosphohydrolase/phosphomutase
MLGIDGLDADLLRVYGPSLPHLRRLMLESPFLELTSSFPPEPALAWTSVYTGLNPARHGLAVSAQPDSLWARIRGQTFWDRAGQAGRRVCILNPGLACSPWSVNGIMRSLPPESPQSDHDDVPATASPSALFSPSPDATAIPSERDLAAFCQSLYARCEQQATLGLECFKREPCDLFFLRLDALPAVQRLLWRYCDSDDPAYPGYNDLADTIPAFYRLFDRIIGDFRSHLEADCVLLVLSAYGQGRSCVSNFHLNEWLRLQGLLTPRPAPAYRLACLSTRRFLLKHAQGGIHALLNGLHLQEMLSRRACHRPYRQINEAVDCQQSLAYMVEFTANSPFGGLVINRAKAEREGYQYERLRGELLRKLMQLRVQGQMVVYRAQAREEYYRGEYSEQFPDIIFELHSAFHASGSLYLPLVTPSMAHRVISGNNHISGVLLLGNLAAASHTLARRDEPRVVDVAPTVLHLLGMTDTDGDGQPLVPPPATYSRLVPPLLSLPALPR